MKKPFLKNPGFTLIEVMIGLGVSAILVLGLTRLFSATLNSYSLQEQLTEMNQNAKFAIKEISDVLMQAGADCELVTDTLEKDNIIQIDTTAPSPCDSFVIKVNPRGGLFIVPQPCTLNTSVASCSLQVDKAKAFLFANKLGKIPESNSAPTHSIKTYSLVGVDTVKNKIIITGGIPKDTFRVGDGLYSFNSQGYYLLGTNLCLNSDTNVMAENIDSLKITFMDSTGATTKKWGFMKSVKLIVEATTSLPDNRYSNPPWNDHRRRLKLTYQFSLKNKV